MDHVSWPALHRGLVAILRGITPAEAPFVADALIDAGLEVLEVPLNSPDALRSIDLMSQRHGDVALIGGGTILGVSDVDAVAAVGGQLMVSPNMNPEVIARAASHRMVTMPGVLTPTEAFGAIAAGASALKFFPASVLGAQGISAMMAVLPRDAVIGAVGGVGADNMADYVRVGVTTFGIGTAVYKPGDTPAEAGAKARSIVAAYDRAMADNG